MQNFTIVKVVFTALLATNMAKSIGSKLYRPRLNLIYTEHKKIIVVWSVKLYTCSQLNIPYRKVNHLELL